MNKPAIRRGQSLVEFAVVALVLYMLLAAILTFGHALYVAQGLQGAVDLAAREISRTPLPAVTTFEAVLNDGSLDDVYQNDLLVFDLDTLGGQSFFEDIVPDWPPVNQQLAAVMIVDRPDFDGDGTPDANLIRYPGALLSDPSTPTGFTVGIPLVTGRDATGTETIRWVPVVEEIENDANQDPFSVDSPQQGIVALRINYPFQSASMSSFQPNVAGPFEPTVGTRNVASDDSVNETNAGDRPGGLIGQPLLAGENFAGTYGGQYGLGAQGAFGQTVRPFRRVISAQAIYRREVFAN
ncbi:TadE/TadG family type IV pilus assembly protein [Stieleria varia]|uniref:TadE-like protein n=1 Tax=Stieleria varia TaxID=2528005 RepID=A0A5C6A5Q6_9BACT|nr:TadE family protein [Stieleria varia]TWT94720.1 TadE-like protein [Stieleria varia]